MLTNISVHEPSSCTTELRYQELEERISPLVVIAIIAILIGLLAA